MSKIKTRESVKNIKILDKAAVASKHMKTAFVRSKDQTVNLMNDDQVSPSEYAEDKIKYAAEDVVGQAGHGAVSGAKSAVQKAKKAYKRKKEFKGTAPNAEKVTAKNLPQRTVQNQARGYARTSGKARNQTIKTVNQTEHTVKQTARVTGKATAKTLENTVKTSNKAIKTAQATQKATIKTAQLSSKAIQKTAQTSAKTAKLTAKATAKTASATAKATANAAATTIKSIIAGLKTLIAIIAAGGWIAIILIIIICLIGLIVSSCFGIFFSSEDTGGESMTEVVQEINADYDNELEEIKSSTRYDVLEMSGTRAVWKEVLSVYAVKTTTDEDNPQEVASMDDTKKELLKDIFWEMNEISSRTETKTETIIEESDDGNGNIVETEVKVTQVYLYITVTHKTADEIATAYNFSKSQKEQLEDLLSDENNPLWNDVLYGITSTDEQIVAVALSQVGNVGGEPYWSWYGFGSRVEWCACFVSWCANELGYIEAGIIPKYAGCVWGVQWFKERGQWADNSIEPAPGMIIFFDWDDPNGSAGGQDGLSDHTGIVEKVENGRVWTIEGNSADSCRQRSYPIGYYEIFGYGIPAY